MAGKKIVITKKKPTEGTEPEAAAPAPAGKFVLKRKTEVMAATPPPPAEAPPPEILRRKVTLPEGTFLVNPDRSLGASMMAVTEKATEPETKAAPPAKEENPTFKFFCYRCGQKLQVFVSWAGAMHPCPMCKSKVLVPPPPGTETA
jgi:hypothetical protein